MNDDYWVDTLSGTAVGRVCRREAVGKSHGLGAR